MLFLVKVSIDTNKKNILNLDPGLMKWIRLFRQDLTIWKQGQFAQKSVKNLPKLKLLTAIQKITKVDFI